MGRELRTDTGWERLTDLGGLRWDAGELERTAEAVTQAGATGASADGIEHDGHACFPMRVGLKVIGIVGIGVAESSFEVRRKLSAAAAFLSVAVNNARLFAEVRAHGFKDDVTGCHNRKHTLEILQAEAARARRTNASLSVVMFDVDNFKAINDQHGHSGGDAVLGAIGARLRESLRKSDVRCRYGGDEFLIGTARHEQRRCRARWRVGTRPARTIARLRGWSTRARDRQRWRRDYAEPFGKRRGLNRSRRPCPLPGEGCRPQLRASGSFIAGGRQSG